MELISDYRLVIVTQHINTQHILHRWFVTFNVLDTVNAAFRVAGTILRFENARTVVVPVAVGSDDQIVVGPTHVQRACVNQLSNVIAHAPHISMTSDVCRLAANVDLALNRFPTDFWGAHAHPRVEPVILGPVRCI